MKLRSGKATRPKSPRPGASLTVPRSEIPKSPTQNTTVDDSSEEHSADEKKRKKRAALWYPKNIKRSRIAKRAHLRKLAQRGPKHVNLTRVPPEIWLNVFDKLDYFDLKKCAKVSKQFKALVDRKTFDKTLHRSHPALTATGVRVSVHPILFEFCHCNGTNPTMEDVTQDHKTTEKEIDIKKIEEYFEPHKSECVTEPALTVLHIESESTLIRKRVINESGITIHDMLRGIHEAMTPAERKLGWPKSAGWTLRECCRTCVKEGRRRPFQRCPPEDKRGPGHEKYLTLRMLVDLLDEDLDDHDNFL